MNSYGPGTPPQIWESGPQFVILEAGPYGGHEGGAEMNAAIQDGLVPPLEHKWEHMLDGKVTREVAVCDD
jgi:hypothetical protein